jgi:regulator of sirC expression with transglutaminase-like and TPR domain
VTQHLRQLGHAELAGSTRAVGKLAQSDARFLVHRLDRSVAHAANLHRPLCFVYLRAAMGTPAISARQLFTREARQPERDLDLARAALLVAKEQYPGLAIEQYLARLDQLAEEVKDRLADETAPLVVLEELTRTLYQRHNFRGNRDTYYDPRNSFLNDVLDRRTGIPLTLGIVLLEVGWRLKLPLEGVNFPHHFLIRFQGDAMALLVDPFDGGRARFEDEAQELLDRVYGGKVRLQESFLRRATKLDILVRLLTNLKGVFLNAGDHPRALAVVERLIILRPEGADDHRAHGVLLARLGQRKEAIEELQRWLASGARGDEAERTRRLIEKLELGADPDPLDIG